MNCSGKDETLWWTTTIGDFSKLLLFVLRFVSVSSLKFFLKKIKFYFSIIFLYSFKFATMLEENDSHKKESKKDTKKFNKFRRRKYR